MNFLCDVHISFKLLNHFKKKNHSVQHVNHLPKKWFTPDDEITEYADKNGFVLITKDSDFRKSFILKKAPRKLIRITLGNISNDELIQIFEKHDQLIFDTLNKSDYC